MIKNVSRRKANDFMYNTKKEVFNMPEKIIIKEGKT